MEQSEGDVIAAMGVFFQRNKRFLTMAKNLGIVDINVYCKISRNRALFSVYNAAGCYKFPTVREALKFAHGKGIVVCFMELGLYGVFEEIEPFHEFCKHLRNTIDGDIAENVKIDEDEKKRESIRNGTVERDDDIEDDEWMEKKEKKKDVLKVSLCQIVLPNQPQKLVFTSTGDFSKLIGTFVKECLGSKISVVNTEDGQEITVLRETYDDAKSAQDIYRKLYSFVAAKNGAVLKTMNPLPEWESDGVVYTRSHVTEAYKESLDELKNILRYLPSTSPVNIYIGSIGGKNNCTHFGNTDSKESYTEQLARRPERAQRWIEINLPRMHESSGDYYQKYKANHPVYLSIQKFTSIVETNGYKINRGPTCNTWIPKS